MDHGWRIPAGPPPSSEQHLGAHDCDPTVGVLVLRGDVARLFAPSGCDWPFDYYATLLLHGGRRAVVRVFKVAAGRETRLGDGWSEICYNFSLSAGCIATFEKDLHEDRTFVVCFFDDNGNALLCRRFDDAPDGDDPPSSPEFQVDGDWLRARGAVAGRGWQEADGAGGGGDRALQVDDDMTISIREAMDLAVECGAREGSDEHYMATKLFVKAENRAMFLTFRTNAGRLQWLRRCYQDRMN